MIFIYTLHIDCSISYRSHIIIISITLDIHTHTQSQQQQQHEIKKKKKMSKLIQSKFRECIIIIFFYYIGNSYYYFIVVVVSLFSIQISIIVRFPKNIIIIVFFVLFCFSLLLLSHIPSFTVDSFSSLFLFLYRMRKRIVNYLKCDKK